MTDLPLQLNVQAGSVNLPGGGSMSVVPSDMVLLYWLALAAPAERIAKALHVAPDAVPGRIARLEHGLGTPLEGLRLSLSNASAPCSHTAWPDRHALTLIRRGLSRPSSSVLAYSAEHGALTTGEAKDLVARIARGLGDSCVNRGDWVAVDATQRLESFLVVQAILLIGAVAVRLSDSIGSAALQEMLRQAPVAATFSDRFHLIGETECGRRISFSDEPGPHETSLADWLAACGTDAANLPAAEVKPTDTALVGFTSGSTGVPRVVETSHEAVFRTTEAATRRFSFASSDVFCTATDFTALSAFRSMLTLPYACGGLTVLPSREALSHPLALARDCANYGVTRLTAVPNVFRGLAKAGQHLDSRSLSSLRTAFSGSGVIDPATADAFRAATGVAIVDYYGAREFGTVAYADGDPAKTMSAGGGSGSEALIRVLAPDGTPLDAGVAGELHVHTDGLTLDAVTEEGEMSGWFATGDLGVNHADGRLEIVGRLRDIVKTHDGSLVAPAEVEATLHSAAAVREACVFGWIDHHGIERLGAVVIPADGLAKAARASMTHDLQSLVRDALGNSSVPARIRFQADLPRLPRGKVDKQQLRHDFESGHWESEEHS